VTAAGVDHGFEGGGTQGPFDGPGVEAEDLQSLGGALQSADGSGQGTAEHAHDGSGFQAVADDVADRDGEPVGRDVDDVVPVAAHVEGAGGGQVAHRDIAVMGQVGDVEHGLLQGDGDLAFAGVGLAQFLVQPLQLPRPCVQLGLQSLRLLQSLAHPDAGGVGGLVGFDESGDVLDPVDDVDHLPVLAQDGGVHRGPPAFLEHPRPAHDRDVVLLQGHRVRLAGGQDPMQGSPEVADPVGLRVTGIVGESGEDVLAE
jgi:hypothetical protein